MSSDVRRTTIADRLAEALRNLSFAAQITGGTAGRDEGLCKTIDAATTILAEYGRTRPPEAARSPEPDDDDDDPQPGVNTRTSPSPDPRGRSGDDVPTIDLDVLAWESIKEAARKSPWIPAEYMANDWHADVIAFLSEPPAAPATTGVHVAHCCVKHGCKYGNPNCPVASGELAGDGSCESCADEPATTGARAETVAPDAWWNGQRPTADGLCEPSINWDCEDTKHDIPLYAGFNPCHLTAPPEVTHGAAIGGDVVTDWRAFPDEVPPPDTLCIVLSELNSGELFPVIDEWRMQSECPVSFSTVTVETGYGWNEHDDDVKFWRPIGPLPSATASTRSDGVDYWKDVAARAASFVRGEDGGDDGRDAK